MPLHFAAVTGHAGAVEALLAAPGVEVDAAAAGVIRRGYD